MSETAYMLPFGKHKGKTLDQLAAKDPAYLLWLGGIESIRSLKDPSCACKRKALQESYPQIIRQCEDFIKDRCWKCWAYVDSTASAKHFCAKMAPSSAYHYHPYGKRG